MSAGERNRRLLASAAALSLTFAAGHALAQQRPTPSGDTTEIAEVVVTVNRREQALQDVPASVAAVSGDQLVELGITSAQDLATQIPSLNIIGAFNQSSPQINVRGVGNNGFTANAVSTVGIFMDEVYLNQTIGQGLQIFDLERVELLRGPQGTLYGVNTTSGALNFISAAPRDEFEASGSLSYGDYQAMRAEIVLNAPLGERTAMRLSGMMSRSDGFKYNSFLQRDAEFLEDYAVRWQLRHDAGGAGLYTLRISVAKAHNDGMIFEQEGLVDPGTGAACSVAQVKARACTDFFGYSESSDPYKVTSDVAGFEKLETLGASIRGDWTLGGIDLTSITAYQRTRRKELDDFDASFRDFFTNQYDSDASQISQELRAHTKLGAADLIVGAYYLSEDAGELNPYTLRGLGPGGLTGGASPFLEGVYRNFDLETRSWAVFADATVPLTERFSVSGGLRYTSEEKEVDYEAGLFSANGTNASTFFTLADLRLRTFFPTVDEQSSDKWEAVTGRLTVNYTIADDVLVYGSAARGFRGGNFNANALLAAAEFTIVSPEYIDALEAGIKSQWLDRRLTFNASVFRYAYKDQQVTTVQNGRVGLVNAANSTIYGGEVEVIALPVTGLRAQIGVALLNATYDRFIDETGADLSGNHLENTPAATVNAQLSYEVPIGSNRLMLVTDVYSKSGHYLSFTNNPLSKEGSYILQNFSLSFGPEDGRYSLGLWVKNAWDQDYRRNWADLASFGYNSISIGSPRTVGATFSVRTW